jgi:hypothetical protein
VSTAVRFSGTTDQLTYSGALPTSTGGLTVACWVYLSVDRNDWSCFTRMNEGGTSIIYLTTDGSGTDVGWFSAGGSITGLSFTVGAWAWIAATLSGSTGTLYTAAVNGPVTVVGTSTMVTGAPTELGVGGRGAGDSTEPFNGRIGGWKLWNGILAPAELEAERRQLLPVRTAGLHAAYSRLSGQVEGRLDHSGSGRMLAAGAAAAATEDGPPVPLRLVSRLRILSAPTGGTTTLGQAVETDTATALSRTKSRAIGQSTETDTATALSRSKSTALALATETDTATALVRSKLATLSQATEADTATGLSRSKLLHLGQSTETDTAGPLIAGSVVVLGQAQETDTAGSLSRSKLRPIGLALETDTALAFAGTEVPWPPTCDPPRVTVLYTADSPVVSTLYTADPPTI